MQAGDVVMYRWAGSSRAALVLKREVKAFDWLARESNSKTDAVLVQWIGGEGPRPSPYRDLFGKGYLMRDRYNNPDTPAIWRNVCWVPAKHGGFDTFSKIKKV